MRKQSAIATGAVLLMVGTAACGATTTASPTTTVTVTQTPPTETVTVTALPELAPEETQEPIEASTSSEPPPPTSADRAMTLAQEQAVEEAQSYLDYSGFSEQGLLEQLTSEYGAGFEKADAQFAIDYLNPDWNAEAAESAASYLDSGSFSRSGLLEQLTSEYGAGFTKSQALFGLKAVGY